MGNLKNLIVPSPWRTKPNALIFKDCGGCQWQHIDTTKQAEIKKDILQEILQRLGGQKEIPPVTVISSPQSYGYRARVQLKVMKRHWDIIRPDLIGLSISTTVPSRIL